jgi:Uma2 family endonuclease
MSTAATSTPPLQKLPTHLDLPETDGAIVENFLEHPQSFLLSSSIWPVLRELHPEGNFVIGQDSGIYWKLTDPPLDGCRSPDWYYVPDVLPSEEGQYRRSYVLWQEIIPPLIIIEYVSGTGREERDPTPWKGMFWVYERAIGASYYVIYEVEHSRIEAYHLVNNRFVRMEPNARGHFEIPELGVELGLWHATYMNYTVPWLRFFDPQGNLLPSAEERAEQERQRAEQEHHRAEHERQRAEQLAAKLRALGIDPAAE